MVFHHPTFPLIVALGLGATAAIPPQAGAQPKALKSTTEWDYSRFRDGPRRVPEPRGASLRRAESLDLGTRRAAGRLLRRPPEERWRRAARGRIPSELSWPVPEGHFGRGFGYVRHRRPDLRHDGVDIVAEEGAVIRAVADGIVAYSDNGIRGFGNCLLIVHPNGWVSLYAHNFRNTVQAGWRIERGERIGFVGHTGIARGPHLHFELRVDGRAVDPIPKLAQVRRKGDPPLTATRASDGDPTDNEVPATQVLAGAHLGTVTTARRLMREPASEALREATDARRFRNLLWPVRGGRAGRPYAAGRHRGLDIEAEPGAAVRAAADGLVVYAGQGLDGVGKAVVMLHRNGWVTLYGGNRELNVEAGDTVRRGEWIGEVGDSGTGHTPHLHFELHDAGTLRDPAGLLVQVPEGVAFASR